MPVLSAIDLLLAAFGAVAGGLVNAFAGGGTLVTFPVLLALGLPSVEANVTNTVALLPGYVAGALAQAGDLRGQGRRLSLLVPAALAGGLAGGLLLLVTSEKLFRHLVPFLILLASALLALQEPARRWLERRLGQGGRSREAWPVLPVMAASVYGGYFGAGLSVIVLAALGLVLRDSLTRLNATKQVVGFSANAAAAVLFLFSGRVVWPAALVMMAGAIGGGALGGRLAGRVRPAALRALVVSIGVAVGLVYLVRG